MLRPRAGSAESVGLADERRKRDLLFGPNRGRSSSASTGVSVEQEQLEARNEEFVGHLAGQVTEMRHVALHIGNEVRNQNEELLERMGAQFDNAGNMLSHTIRRVQQLSTSGGIGHMCILVVFSFLFLTLVYLLLVRR